MLLSENFVPITKENYNEIKEIYRQGIETGLATFETETKSWEQWNQSYLPVCRIAYIFNDKIVGWAALSPVSKRKVYRGVAEVSVYIHEDCRGQGLGVKILNELVSQSEQNGFWTLQSGIMSKNIASIKIHKNAGFRIIGVRERVAQLDGVWLDNTIMERRSIIVGY